MFEQTFKNVDDVLWKEAGCSSELDYTEQSSWMLFLRYLDDLEAERAMEAELLGKSYSYIIDEPHRWSKWAAPKKADGSFDHDTVLTGDDLIDYVNDELFPYLRGFKQRASSPDTIEYKIGEIFFQAVNRLTTLLSDILDLARVEANMMPIHSKVFNLRDVLTQALDLFEPIAVQSGVRLTRHLDPGLPILVVGDAIRLQQVLTNLIGNAFKFTKSGHVHVEAYALPSHSDDALRVFFAIEDTGCGIAEKDLGNLFQPFSQVSQGYTRSHQGAGLGLSISKQLVGLMGGNMAVESEEGLGTTFAFCVTFGKETQPHNDQVAIEDRTEPVVSRRILLAEDDETTAFSISRLLERSGDSVAVARNGQEAQEMHEANNFDLILMDVSMPIMDGIEACQRIRGSRNSHKRDIPIIALTAYAMAGDKERFLAAGMNGYVSKPVNMVSLMQTMSEALAEQRR